MGLNALCISFCLAVMTTISTVDIQLLYVFALDSLLDTTLKSFTKSTCLYAFNCQRAAVRITMLFPIKFIENYLSANLGIS